MIEDPTSVINHDVRRVGRHLGVTYDARGFAIPEPPPQSFLLEERAAIMAAQDALNALLRRHELRERNRKDRR